LHHVEAEVAMPGPATILEGLRAIANGAIGVAALWHVAVLAASIALVRGWRPPQPAAGALLAAPVASVALLAFRFGNPFNGILFAALALAMLALAARLPKRPVERGSPAASVAAILLIVFAWVYPHFLGQRSATAYLVAAPLGLIPCPTLSLVIGFTLLAGGFGSRGWSLLLVAAGLFYSLVGVARLGVWLDVALGGGALCLLALSGSLRVARRQRIDKFLERSSS
jgi:hypothetical protein